MQVPCTVIDNRAIGQNGTDGAANLLPLIAAIDASGNPSQTKKNVKIMFVNCDFLKINECKYQYETDKHESSVLSARILHTEQEPCCRKEATSCRSTISRSRHRVNSFRLSHLSCLSRHVLGTPLTKLIHRCSCYNVIIVFAK